MGTTFQFYTPTLQIEVLYNDTTLALTQYSFTNTSGRDYKVKLEQPPYSWVYTIDNDTSVTRDFPAGFYLIDDPDGPMLDNMSISVYTE